MLNCKSIIQSAQPHCKSTNPTTGDTFIFDKSKILHCQEDIFRRFCYTFDKLITRNLTRCFQSVVILSLLPFNNLFNKICAFVAPEYFDNGDVSLETVCYNINSWPPPTPGVTLNLPLLGSVFQVCIIQFRFSGFTNSYQIRINKQFVLIVQLIDQNYANEEVQRKFLYKNK